VPAGLHVDQQPSTRGDELGVARPHVQRQHLAVLGQVRDRAGQREVHRAVHHVETERDDVAELQHRADLAVQRDLQHAVGVPVGDEEAALVRLHRVRHTGGHEEVEVRGRRVLHRPRADVGDDLAGVVLDAEDAGDGAATDVLADHRGEGVHRRAEERDVHGAAGFSHEHLRRQARGDDRRRPGLRLDPGHLARDWFGHVQGTVGPHRAARAARQAGHQ
jgi:hypothetical protein